ncbi:Sensor histidine kinase YehU [Salinivirga cyanobacteriivorans]|uniref:Sensor histidine kinase YehU n=1 Tax=Salinivirga cyanobacteriivorans TaxID=1307839 RepID=A0A0S2I453_9BACT|nr:histidine kinase [Salinivirga cyanobacteriivorans]ALO17015.1 Sensor histidine kinase YehU [Salinivirga cyanobacteriivorans]
MQIFNPQTPKPSPTVISLVWTASTAVHIAFLYFLAHQPIKMVIIDAVVFNSLFVIFSIGVFMGLEYEGTAKPFWRRIMYLYLPMLALIVTLWLLASYSMLTILIEDEDYLHALNDSITYRALIGVFLFSIVVIVQQLIHYYRNYQQKELKTSKLENELQRSKVNTLQMQMQPHFLFNALNSISSLTFEDSEKTRQMLIKLSEFLRYTTKYSEKQLVKLSDELSHIDQYLAIEHLRFGERLKYEKKVSPEAETRFLPCLVLQPVIENAIKHGVNQSIDPVKITLNAKTDQDKLVITITNTKEGESRKKGTGTGLKNLSNRLKILYSNRARLHIENTKTLFTVKIVIP